MPLFSVIIPSYNRYNSLIKAIDSVLSQTFNDFELIVIDDGSSDETSNIIDEYPKQLKYIKQPNLGVSKARNTGILNSNSQYTAFLDSDDVWLPEKLEEQYNYIKGNPETRVNQTDEIWIRNGKRVNPKKKHGKIYGDIFIESLDLCLISPSAVVLENSVFEKYGVFDENMPVCEDYDLWLRVTSEEPVGLVNKKLMKRYGGHDSQLSRRYPVMDIYRIYSILKLITDKKDKLKSEYREKAIDVVRKKSDIIIQGAKKRENNTLLIKLEKIIHLLNVHNYNSIDFQNLLEELPVPLLNNS